MGVSVKQQASAVVIIEWVLITLGITFLVVLGGVYFENIRSEFENNYESFFRIMVICAAVGVAISLTLNILVTIGVHKGHAIACKIWYIIYIILLTIQIVLLIFVVINVINITTLFIKIVVIVYRIWTIRVIMHYTEELTGNVQSNGNNGVIHSTNAQFKSDLTLPPYARIDNNKF